MTANPMSKDISCQNFKGLIAYIRKHYGEGGIQKLTDGLIDCGYFVQDKYRPSEVVPVQEAHLVDPAYWVSNEFSLKLLENVNHIVDGQHPLRTAGKGVVKESLSKTSLFFAQFLGLRVVAGRVEKINQRFNNTKNVRLLQLSEGSASFELNYKPGVKVTKDVCDWNLGIYSGIAELSGQVQVQGRETACLLDGDAACRFEITWKKQRLWGRIINTFRHAMLRRLVKELITDYERILEERDRLIDRLAKSEKKYRTLFEESRQALSLSQNGRLIDVNPAWCELHGCGAKAEVIGRRDVDFVHPEDRRRPSDRTGSESVNSPAMVERRHRTQSGQDIEVEVYSSRIEYDGNESILSMVKDVTARKRAEENRRQLEARVLRAEKMETVATLAGGVAHDLNNILSGIVGYPELILMQLADDSPLKGPIQTMHDSAQKAAAIVQDLLTLSRRGAMSMEVLNLNRIIREYRQSPESEKMLSYHPQVTIETDLADDLFAVKGSPVHVSKTIMNLVSNAVEAMPEGGIVRVKTENCYVDTQLQAYEEIREGEYCLLTVTDTGVGISEEDRNKIFEPFFTKKKMGRSGTGLGMAVVWGTVKDHGGYVNVESKIGQGTCIKIYFPATRIQAKAAKPSMDHSELKGRGEKILVIDDVAEQRQIAVDMLNSLGYVTEAVQSGEEAVDYLKTHACDLLILDMIMDPGMDGLATYREILKSRPYQKAIIASGYSETDRVKEAQRIGAGAYIRKPYTLEKIGLTVKSALDGRPDG